MSEPWEDFSADSDGPWNDFRDASPTPRADKRRKGKGLGRKVDAAVRGAADFLSFGFADELAAVGESLPALIDPNDTYGEAYARNIREQRTMDAADREDVPVSRGAGQVAGFGAGVGHALGRTAARAGREWINYLRAGAEGAGLGALAAAGNAQGGLSERSAAAVPGAALGAAAGLAARPVAQVVGAGINALTVRAKTPMDRAAQALRSHVDPAAARKKAEALRAAGAEPTPVSAMDESGRAYVRAAASRMTPARETVQRRADAAAVNLPDRIAHQTRRHVSANPRPMERVVDELDEARSAEARTAYAGPYAEQIEITPAMASALSGREGKAAIEAAIATAEGRRDYAVIADLRKLQRAATEGLPKPGVTLGVATEPPPIPRVSGAALDRVQQELGRRARNLTRSIEDPNNALAAGLTGRQRDINAGLDAVPGLRPAREAYKTATRNIEAAEEAASFLKPDAGQEFAERMAAASDLQPARDVAARSVISAAGENPSAAPGIARRLADAREQQARNRALLGDEAAEAFQDSMAAEARVVRDLQDVAPRTGWQNQLRTQDHETVSGIAAAAQAFAGGPAAWIGVIANRLRTLGLSDRDAQAVAEIATDAAQLDDLLARMEQMRPGYGEQLRKMLTQAVARELGEETQPRPVIEAYVEGRPDLGYGAVYAPN